MPTYYLDKNLTGHSVQSTYTNLLQMVSGSILVDGLGSSSLDFNTYTASYCSTASVISAGGGVSTSSYTNTSSIAVSSSYSITSSYSISSSYSITSSYSISSSYTNTSSYANTSSIAITSSYSNNTSSVSISSSYSNTASYAVSSSYADTASLALTVDGINDFFEKSDSTRVAFTVMNSCSLGLGVDLLVSVNNNPIVFTSASTVTMPNPLLAGNDYGVYATYDNQLIATYTTTGSALTASAPLDGYTVPTGYTSANSRLIGGFYFGHSGSVPISTISKSRDSGGVNATASVTCSSGHNLVAGDYIDVTCIATTPVFTYNIVDAPIISVSGDTIYYANSGSVDTLNPAGLQIWRINNSGSINSCSLWDLKFRPRCSDPRGMVLVDNRFWVDIWLTGNNYLKAGSSRKGQRIADGENTTSYPLKSTKMGGTGITTYGDCTWYSATEVAAHWEKQLLSYADYQIAAYGTSEAAAFGTDPQYTCRNSVYTSKWGMEQASGVMFIWGSDLNYRWDLDNAASAKQSTFRSRDSSSIATITCSAAHGLNVGEIISILSFGGTNYNKSLTTVVSASSLTTFTYNCLSASLGEGLTADTAGRIYTGLPAWTYYAGTGGRGSIYQQGAAGYSIVAGLFGGSWAYGADAGSRYSHWSYYVWVSSVSVGFRLRCDHLVVS